jgi:hypothetical protein
MAANTLTLGQKIPRAQALAAIACLGSRLSNAHVHIANLASRDVGDVG